MNREQAIKKIEELKRFVRECDDEEQKKYYYTYVCENIIYNSQEKGKLEEDVVYEDKNIIVEHNKNNETYVSYKNGKKQ